jgi:hypothetical protein
LKGFLRTLAKLHNADIFQRRTRWCFYRFAYATYARTTQHLPHDLNDVGRGFPRLICCGVTAILKCSWLLPDSDAQPPYQRSLRRRDHQACRACRWPRLVHDGNPRNKEPQLVLEVQVELLAKHPSLWRANERCSFLAFQDAPKTCPALLCMPWATLMLQYGSWRWPFHSVPPTIGRYQADGHHWRIARDW